MCCWDVLFVSVKHIQRKPVQKVAGITSLSLHLYLFSFFCRTLLCYHYILLKDTSLSEVSFWHCIIFSSNFVRDSVSLSFAFITSALPFLSALKTAHIHCNANFTIAFPAFLPLLLFDFQRERKKLNIYTRETTFT